MAWGSPLFLLAGVLVAIPILLHLRRRRRMVPLTYSSLLFLLPGARRQNRQSALRHRVLLALRTAAVLLLCLFFARPTLRTAETAVAPEKGGAALVIVLDQSLSMAASDRGVVRFDRARERAAAILASLSPDDRVGLVLASERPSRLTPALTTDRVSLARRLAQLSPLPVGSDNWSGLHIAGELLKDAEHPEIVLITDMQRSAFERAAAVEEATRQLDLHILDVGYDGTENAALVGLTVEPARPVPGRPVVFKLSAARYQATLPATVDVRARLFSEFEQTARVLLPVAGVQPLPFTAEARPSPPPGGRAWGEGPRVMQFQLAGDALPDDNTWLFSLDAAPPRPWYVLEGDPGANRGRGSGYYLASALRAHSGDARLVQVVRTDADFSGGDLVACFGASSLPEGDLRVRLDAFLRRGGLALFFAPPRVDAESWNARLLGPFFDAGLSNAPAGARAGRLARVDFSHPFFSLWADARNGDPLTLRAPLSYGWTSPPGRGRVAAWLAGGTPAILDLPVGAGRLVFLNFTPAADQRLDELWISLLGEIITGSAAQSARPLAYSVGDNVPVRAEAPRGVSTVIVDVEGPDGAVSPLPLASNSAPGVFEGHVPSLARPGVYHVAPSQPSELVSLEPRLFCVNASRRDSDLARIDRAELESRLGGYRVDWIANRAEASDVLTAHRRGRSLQVALLFLLLAAWLAETIVGVWGIRAAPAAPPAAEVSHV